MQLRGPLCTTLSTTRLKRTRPREYLIRFVFGGLVTTAAGAVGLHWGPVVGGLFLAFPSILPASLTLVSEQTRLPMAAGADALGAALGSLGLLVFALLMWAFAPTVPAWLLLLGATVLWCALACTTWATFQGWHRRRHHPRASVPVPAHASTRARAAPTRSAAVSPSPVHAQGAPQHQDRSSPHPATDPLSATQQEQEQEQKQEKEDAS